MNFYSDTRLTRETLLRAINANLPEMSCVRVWRGSAASVRREQGRDAQAVSLRDSRWPGRRPVPAAVLPAMPSTDSMPTRWHGRHRRCSAGTTSAASRREWPNRLSSVRTITHLAVNRFGDYIWIDVEADGFLYNMVRAIAGTLMNVGRGFWPESKVAEILNAEDRKEAGPTAPAWGLFLMRVTYG